ncbi:type I RM system specificity subunit [Anabaena sp. 90]|nr:type I RM system specificity subunit [Anabaena sp. 90]
MSSEEMELMVDSRRLPVGWNIKYLDELCENLDSKRIPITKSSRKSGNIPYYGASGIVDYVADYIFNEDLLLVSEDGANLLARTYPIAFSITGKTWVNNHAHVLRFKEKITQSFIEYYLNSISLESYVSGMAQPKLNQKSLNSIAIPIPPLPEQKRIVAIADEAFEGIDRAIRNTEKNLSNARELFESYLNSKLLPIVSSNLTQTLSSVTDLIVDCEHKTAPTQETGIPSIRTPNIGKGYLIFDNVNRVSEEIYELWTRRAKPEPGDLILAREAPAGNVGVIPEGYKVCLGQRTVLIRPNKKSVDSQYLAFLLLHPLMQKRLLAKSTGATVQHVNMKDIRELAINELPPIQTQRDCIEDLKQLESQSNRLESIYRQKIAALKELKQSILQKAFTGELTADKGEK